MVAGGGMNVQMMNPNIPSCFVMPLCPDNGLAAFLGVQTLSPENFR
jgi:hypothetical protein